MKRIASAIILLAAICCGTHCAAAQAVAQPEGYRLDGGIGLGMAGYIGDLNSTPFSSPGFEAQASLRYLFNTRLAVRCLVDYATLRGSSEGMDNVIPSLSDYSFSSSVYGLSARGEFNFFNYGIGETYKQLKRVSPYIALGLGFVVASSKGSNTAALTIPMALGVKYKIKPRLNLALEFAMTKLFTDKADSRELDDPYLIKSSYLKNTDWQSSLVVTLSYEFGERCIACNRID